MKVAFKLADNTNDKGTGFAGSLHAGSVLSALELFDIHFGKQQPAQDSLLHSHVFFKRPITDDYVIEASLGEPGELGEPNVRCFISDQEGLKVRSIHEWCDRQESNIHKVSSSLGQNIEALPNILSTIQKHFPIYSRLSIDALRLYEKGLMIEQKPHSKSASDQRTYLMENTVLAYLAAWSLGSAYGQRVGEVDVLVSKAQTWINLENLEDGAKRIPVIAIPETRQHIDTLKADLKNTGKAKIELKALAGPVLLHGLFHVRLKSVTFGDGHVAR